MGLLDDFDPNKLYGAGGPGDPLIALGMGLLSQRGVGRGLAAGIQNVATMGALNQQRQRQATLDKMAADREARAAANQEFMQRHYAGQDQFQRDQAAIGQKNWQSQFDASRSHEAAALQAQKEAAARAEQHFAQDYALKQEALKPHIARDVQERTKVISEAGQDPNEPSNRQWILTGKFNQPAASGPSLNDDAIDFTAKQILAGDPSAMTNLGRGAQGGENVTAVKNRIAQLAKEQGIDAKAALNAVSEFKGQQASARTLGTQEANAAAAGSEASNAIGIGREASAALPRGNWVPANLAIQAWQKGSSNPQLAAFGQAMATIANTYARAVNPKGLPHEHVVKDTLDRLSAAQGPDALNAMLDIMDKEIGLAQKSPAQARDLLKSQREGAPTPVSGKTPANLSWSLEK